MYCASIRSKRRSRRQSPRHHPIFPGRAVESPGCRESAIISEGVRKSMENAPSVWRALRELPRALRTLGNGRLHARQLQYPKWKKRSRLPVRVLFFLRARTADSVVTNGNLTVLAGNEKRLRSRIDTRRPLNTFTCPMALVPWQTIESGLIECF